MALWTLSLSSRLVQRNYRRLPYIPRGGQQQASYVIYNQPEEFLMSRFFMMLRLFIFFPAAVYSHAPTPEAKRRSQAALLAHSDTTAWPSSSDLLYDHYDGAVTSSPEHLGADRPAVYWTPPKTIKITVALGRDVGSDDLSEMLSQPLIKEWAWNAQSGAEFQQKPELTRKLALMGEQVATNDGPDEWIKWKLYKDDPNGISVWTGRAQKEGCYGSQLPLIKSRSVIPLSCKEMVDLMMDSSKVPMYNKWSLGRKDCWVLDDHTKIVQNLVKPPIGSKHLVSTTLLHACPLDNDAWVIVSRAVRGFPEPADASKTEILLGVNLVEPLGDNACRLTSVNHVYTSGVPTMLAESLGVKSAIKFVNDIRRLREEGEI
jgi:hypothetical protein